MTVLWAIRQPRSEELAHIRGYLLQGGKDKQLFPSTLASDLTGKVRYREKDKHIDLLFLTTTKMEKRAQTSSLYS